MSQRSTASPFSAINGNRWNDPTVTPTVKSAQGYANVVSILDHGANFSSQTKGLHKKLRQQPNNPNVRAEAMQAFDNYLGNLPENQRQELAANLDKPSAAETIELLCTNRKGMGLAFYFGVYGMSISAQKANNVAGTCSLKKAANRNGTQYEISSLENDALRASLKDLPVSLVQEINSNQGLADSVRNMTNQIGINFEEVVNKAVSTKILEQARQSATDKFITAGGVNPTQHGLVHQVSGSQQTPVGAGVN